MLCLLTSRALRQLCTWPRSVLTAFLLSVFPLRHGRIMKNYGLKTMLIVVWGAAIVFASLRVPFLKETSYLVLALFVLSYSLVIVCYASIMIFLIKERKKKNITLRGKTSVVVNTKIERRVALTLAIVIGVFTAFWLPMIVTFSSGLGNHS